jgi:phosphoglycolate phosphatase-like HAD superfamily hydrolase
MAHNPAPRYRGAILDVDGTLVDSNDSHARAWVDAFASNGIDVSFERIRPMIGMGGDKILPIVAGTDDESPLGKAVSEARSSIFCERYLPFVRAFPCVRELLERMHGDGMKLVVASSAKKEELQPLLHIAGVEHLIETKTSSDDVDRSKPDPDVVCAALARCGFDPEHVVMLGDTPYDVTAARRAGVATIALRCGGWSSEDLADALAVFADACDLLAHYDLLREAPPNERER